MAKSVAIIPTYNEKGNIEVLLENIFSLNLPDFFVLVVDDNSPDGTGRLVENLKSRFANLDILHRKEKGGLGPAYVAGFKAALAAGADYIFEMDADLSHDPAYLPEFLKVVASADLVLGSRYIRGGGVKNWNFFRRLISRGGNIYARLILGLPYHDLTGGFKCYRRRVLEAIRLDDLSSVGYNFQIEGTYKTHLAGFKIKELPIVFTERRSGESKFNFKIMLESFYKIIQLKFGKRKKSL